MIPLSSLFSRFFPAKKTGQEAVPCLSREMAFVGAACRDGLRRCPTGRARDGDDQTHRPEERLHLKEEDALLLLRQAH